MKRENVKRQAQVSASNARWWIVGAILILLAGCAPKTGSVERTLSDLFSTISPIEGWTVGKLELYDKETLFDLVDGQADAFFAYGFEQVGVQSYQDAGGQILRVQIWQLAAPADAYGLFTSGITGQRFDVGNDGDIDSGVRVAFWQNRYYAQVFGLDMLPDSDLTAFAQAVARALPSGGERPEVVKKLPADGLVERSALFFRREISVQNEVWLGGENRLGLGDDVECVLARYEIGNETVRLMLIQYVDVKAALIGLAALQDGQVEGVAAVERRGSLVGAVFGSIEEATARELLLKAVVVDH